MKQGEASFVFLEQSNMYYLTEMYDSFMYGYIKESIC